MIKSKRHFRGAKNGLLLFGGVMQAVFLLSCGMKHEVDGEVDVNVKVEVDPIIVRLEMACDKKDRDGIPIYMTRDEYRECVRDFLQKEEKKK